ncbi:uncharacterized protein Z518_03506 [Rhinocladiella mackenziei CBS 650.93]|uniref:Transcription factor domain-containing protein n=1 Tax=Rhinocladiella mackenziei CBS 650.93 TaxID=1442369 RepID=A0A0D2IS69_9EURO|nr:uncharacterized protein Z518_03506 [Rhinocladiella mackenziei CBS 650.93]KIX08849.1 hypothetical protein Z518_03506 [Rhinocladiella mackenziei CBS 650.93]
MEWEADDAFWTPLFEDLAQSDNASRDTTSGDSCANMLFDHEDMWHSPTYTDSSTSHLSLCVKQEVSVVGKEDRCNLKDYECDKDFLQIEERLLRSVGLDVVANSVKSLESEDDAASTIDQPMTEPIALSSYMQNRLVSLYFQTVHTLCPLMDMVAFKRWYTEQPRVSSPLKELVFQAILFAAFQHLSNSEVCQTPFSSVIEGQKALFNYVHSLYSAIESQNEGRVELVQAALLLTYWTPFDFSQEVNSYWVDKAFYHAMIGKLHLRGQPYHSVIWWCCLVRNRTIALGLRSPHKLRHYKPGPMLQVSDFRPSLLVRGMDLRRAPLLAAETFLCLCKISVAINKIVLLRHGAWHWDTWRTYSTSLDQIKEIDQMLDKTMGEFEVLLTKYDERTFSRSFKASLHSVRIIGS